MRPKNCMKEGKAACVSSFKKKLSIVCFGSVVGAVFSGVSEGTLLSPAFCTGRWKKCLIAKQ